MVANACAITAGLYRNVGVITEVPIVIALVRSPTAAIQVSENGRAALVAPGLEVVAHRDALHAVRFRCYGDLDQFTRIELLSRRLVSESEGHGPILPYRRGTAVGSDDPGSSY